MQNFMLEAGVDYNRIMTAATARVVPLSSYFSWARSIQGFSSSAVKG
jgi:multiple sugar transport system permease protein